MGYSISAKIAAFLISSASLLFILESIFWVIFGLLDLGMPVSDEHVGLFFIVTVLEGISILALVCILQRKRIGLPVYALCCLLPYLVAYYGSFTIGLYNLVTLMILMSFMALGGNSSFFRYVYASA